VVRKGTTLSGPPPKNPRTRRRRNRLSTAATLVVLKPIAAGKAPALPKRQPTWVKETRAWWKDVWASPMASEFLDADVHGLFILAELVDDFWREPSAELAAEIRRQRQCFGLTPIDRRRLQWEVVRAETAQAKNGDGKPKRKKPRRDPREALTG
jgi:hypothetical protein